MAADNNTSTAVGRPVASRPPLADRPPEQAQLVWRRALELADAATGDQLIVTLDLLRAAHHSPATLAHASSLGRTYLRTRPEDRAGLGGVAILEAANTFLGIKPQAGDVVSARP